jgi:hypothetical protein
MTPSPPKRSPPASRLKPRPRRPVILITAMPYISSIGNNYLVAETVVTHDRCPYVRIQSYSPCCYLPFPTSKTTTWPSRHPLSVRTECLHVRIQAYLLSSYSLSSPFKATPRPLRHSILVRDDSQYLHIQVNRYTHCAHNCHFQPRNRVLDR